jgi:NADPH:quinone reductase-like Zn-dependent oxidoreductase
VLCGHAGGLIPHDPQFYVWSQTLVGVDLGGYPADVMQQWHAESQAYLDQLMAEGRYRPIVDRVIAFSDVKAAIGDLVKRTVSGRIVVEI